MARRFWLDRFLCWMGAHDYATPAGVRILGKRCRSCGKWEDIFD